LESNETTKETLSNETQIANEKPTEQTKEERQEDQVQEPEPTKPVEERPANSGI
jgi:hypothetical protein